MENLLQEELLEVNGGGLGSGFGSISEENAFRAGMDFAHWMGKLKGVNRDGSIK